MFYSFCTTAIYNALLIIERHAFYLFLITYLNNYCYTNICKCKKKNTAVTLKIYELLIIDDMQLFFFDGHVLTDFDSSFGDLVRALLVDLFIFPDCGELFVWGKNVRGCLGIGKRDDQYFPWRVRMLKTDRKPLRSYHSQTRYTMYVLVEKDLKFQSILNLI